ncbi:MAG: SdrD B-like domain-containing protein [Chitinophagales bacterium]
MLTHAQVSGTVFEEFPVNGTTLNTYGVKDANELGIEGISVTITDASGNVTTQTTASDGTWSDPVTNFPVRVEFSWSSTPYYSSPYGVGSRTTVQFISVSSPNVNMGLYSAYDYHDTATPNYMIPLYLNGDGTGNGATDPALFLLGYNATGLNPDYGGTGDAPLSSAATIGQLGAVWGLAYDKNAKRVYISSLLKRHVGFSQGPSYIHVVDNSSTATYLGAFDLQGVIPTNSTTTIDLGVVCRSATCASSGTGIASDYELPADKGDPNIDLDAFSKIGKMSFGDIDMQPNTNKLWAVNLYQNALIRMDVSSKPINSTPTDVQQYILSTISGYPTSSTGELHPWALAFNNGKGYLGVTNDATSSGAKEDLLCYVLEFDPDNIENGFTTVLSFDPNFNRSVFLGAFYPWKDDWTVRYWTDFNENDITLTIGGAIAHYAQPILSDIDFDINGDMFLSIMDRFGHQTGAQNLWAVSQATELTSSEAKGDVRKACLTPTGYEIDGSGSCSPSGEFVQDMSGNGTQENGEGASAMFKGSNQLFAVSIDPNPNATGGQYYDSQGIMTYGLDDGSYNNWYALYRNASVQLFDKANGLGDIELLSDPAPLEIGNRVWEDTDGDGIQDPDELGIDGVTVHLYDGATLVGTTTTANGGQWYFNDSNVLNNELLPNTTYIIRIVSTDFSQRRNAYPNG